MASATRGHLNYPMTKYSSLTVVALLWSSFALANEDLSLEVLARKASSPSEHIEVSKRYRERAQQFEVRALEYSKEVARLRRSGPDTLAMKWRHARPEPIEQAKQRVIEAQRAANEARALADRHSHAALEKAFAQHRELKIQALAIEGQQ
jgi:hypothetical protein